ncbi:hypothetical protein TNCT_646241 [Trichonephila clavata]|uniref:Uncharacterized protein n=1 Tax=Trichonephila clavata TaxID=2740835 RepID=A0A8X6J8G6_TRICU|nr:hypothetical protein TNCT_646241 [Trichonephila clavata]
MLQYMETPPAFRLDDDITTNNAIAILLGLPVLQYDLRSKPGTFTGMEFSIQMSLIDKLCLASKTSNSSALLSHCKCSIRSSPMPHNLLMRYLEMNPSVL